MKHGLELHLDRTEFMARYWQREPLLIRQAVTNFQAPLCADELAGLALEEGVESRMVEFSANEWHLQHGPFVASDYQREHPWTLLVQAVDHFIPQVAQLQTLIDFIPRWRVDDIMVSYGSDGASVGPHFDNYDVFLLQGEGEKTWQLGQRCDQHTELLPHDDLRILKSFEVSEEYLLRNGDILYVPPGIAHWGIARGESITYSIGFRAPRISELVSRWVDQLLEQLDPEDFYADAGMSPSTSNGEIRPSDIERVTRQLRGALGQDINSNWFGELVTEPRYEAEFDESQREAALALLDEGAHSVSLFPAAKLAWQRQGDSITVFANGQSCIVGEKMETLLSSLCTQRPLEAPELQAFLDDPQGVTLLYYLLDCGCLYVE